MDISSIAYPYLSARENEDMAKKRDKREIRAYTDVELAKLLATIASLQDISLSQLINDSLELYLQQEKIQALIRKHSLDEINGEEED
jgi:dsDNA-binding SOS-regulon protein